ncbi:MAG: type I methionyl aminopeptidase [Clostridiales bacterium]|nr:type I methionyl aminopeptidase [Clostridiales bacterium]
MISLKTGRDIELMRQAGMITAAARALAGEMVKPGVSTKAIDRAVHDFIVEHGATPSFLNYNGYPASVCISINEQVIHGIPGSRRIKEGDIVSIDVGAFYKGYHGDCAATFIAGYVDSEIRKLVEVTRQSFFEGLKFARAGNRVPDISHAIQSYVEKNGFSVVRQFVGHGIGQKLHEEPEVPNFVVPGPRVRLVPGMTLAIEPMVNMGGSSIRILEDGWTVVTEDGKPSAHYENTVLITDGEPMILTPLDGDGGFE